MTAQLSREWLQKTISDIETMRDEMPFGLDEDGNNTLAAFKLALAGMDSEPVKRVNADQMHRVCLEANCHLDKYGAMAREVNKLLLRAPAPPAPVAVPDEMEPTIEAIKSIIPTSNPDEYAACIGADMWNACRAAMQAEPVTAATVPDGWKLVPIIAFPSQWAAGQKAFNSAGINKVDAVYKAMVAAAPAAPEQEV